MYLMSLPRNYNNRTLKFHSKFPRDHQGATSQNYLHKTWINNDYQGNEESYAKIET